MELFLQIKDLVELKDSSLLSEAASKNMDLFNSVMAYLEQYLSSQEVLAESVPRQ